MPTPIPESLRERAEREVYIRHDGALVFETVFTRDLRAAGVLDTDRLLMLASDSTYTRESDEGEVERIDWPKVWREFEKEIAR